MRRDLHLDITEIAAFGTGPRSEQCDETLRHLLKCRDCRSLLPLPTTKEFWRSVLEDRPQSPGKERKELLFSRTISWLSGRLDAFPPPARVTAGAALLFFAIAAFSMLLMFGRPYQTDEGSVAQVSDIYSPLVRPDNAFETSEPESAANGQVSTESRVDVAKTSTSSSPRKGESKLSLGSLEARKLPVKPGNKSLNRSETRGSGTACGATLPVRFEITSTELGMRLNWEKVPGAVSYTAYLSDLDERLIDQFETESENSYLTKSKLVPEITYKWKLVVSLKGGRTMVVTSRNFRSGDIEHNDRQSSQLRRKTVASVRCTEVK